MKQKDVDAYSFDAAVLGQIRRPRYYWPSWMVSSEDLGYQYVKDSVQGFVKVTNPSAVRPPSRLFLGEGVLKFSQSEPFPTAVRWVPRKNAPEKPAGIEDCDEQTLAKWKASGYAMAPYQFKRELGVIDGNHGSGHHERPLNADEKERLHGYKPGHTKPFPESYRLSFIGNGFHCIVVAHLLASWAVGMGYLVATPTVRQLWTDAGYGYTEYVGTGKEDSNRKISSASLKDQVTVISPPEYLDSGEEGGDYVMHLVQDEETVAELHHVHLPPDEYYEELAKRWKRWWPKANPALLEHMMSVLIAFDTATVFAMSFGISKFALAQIEATLVGEIVGRHGRKPNPAIVRAIKNWPPVYTLSNCKSSWGRSITSVHIAVQNTAG